MAHIKYCIFKYFSIIPHLKAFVNRFRYCFQSVHNIFSWQPRHIAASPRQLLTKIGDNTLYEFVLRTVFAQLQMSVLNMNFGNNNINSEAFVNQLEFGILAMCVGNLRAKHELNQEQIVTSGHVFYQIIKRRHIYKLGLRRIDPKGYRYAAILHSAAHIYHVVF